MLKELFEQVVYSENAKLVNWKKTTTGMKYTYMFNNRNRLTVYIDSPFNYEEKHLLELIHKDIIHIIYLEIW